MEKNTKDWKKKEPILIIILCLIFVVVGAAALVKADKLQMIFDPDSLISDQDNSKDQFDPVGYGLQENDERTDSQDDSKEEQKEAQKQENQLHKLDSLAQGGGYKGTKTTKQTEEKGKIYIDLDENEDNNPSDTIVVPEKPDNSDQVVTGDEIDNRIPEVSTEQKDNTQEEDYDDNDPIPEDNDNNGNNNNDNNDNDKNDNGDDSDDEPGKKPEDNEPDSPNSQITWVLDDIAVTYYKNNDAVCFYKEQIPSEEYIKGNLKVISYWHEEGNQDNKKTEVEEEFTMDSIPEEYVHRLTADDVGKSFSLNLEIHGEKKRIQCKILNDTISYISMKVTYKSTPVYVENEPLTKANIQDAIQLDVYGRTAVGNEPVYLPDQKNYNIEFKEATNGIASKNLDSPSGEWTADINYMGMNEGYNCVLQKKDAVKYIVKKHKLKVMYDENTVLTTIYTDEDTVVLNKEYDGIVPYNEMIQKLQENDKYVMNEEGYLTEFFYGWSPYPTSLEGENISYEFKEGQNEQTMYAIPLKELVSEGYLVKQEGDDQVLVGYTGTAISNGVLEIPYGITKVKIDKDFQISDQASTIKKIILSETVNSVDLSAAGMKISTLKAYQVEENNHIFDSDENGLLYSEDGTILWKVPSALTEFAVKDSVIRVYQGALKDTAENAVSSGKTVTMTFLSDNPPELECDAGGTVFGKGGSSVTILVKDPSSDTMIRDLIYKRYVSAWGTAIDTELGEGVTSQLIQTPNQVQNGYENKGGNIYSNEKGKKILEFISKDTDSSYEVEKDVDGIGSYAFYEVEKLQFIKIPDNIKVLKSNALSSMEGNVLQGVEIDSTDQISIGTKVAGETPLRGLHIYLSPKQNELSGWTKQLISDYGEEKTEEILVYAEGTLYMDDQGCVYILHDEEKGLLTLCSAPVDIKSFTEPERYELTKVAEGAFAWCDELDFLDLPDVEEIGNNAFKECSELEIAVFTDEDLGSFDNVFQGCDSLETVLVYNQDLDPVLPEQTTLLKGENYFCDEETIYEKIEEKEYQVINIPTDTQGTVFLKEGTTRIGEDAFAGCDQVTGFYEEQWEDVNQIGTQAFLGCSNLGEETEDSFEGGELTPFGPGILSLNASVIGDRAFENCSGVIKVTLGEDCKILGEKVFKGCNSLETVEWLGDTTSVGDSVFAECKKLEWVYFGDREGRTITTTGNRTFENCTELSMVYLWASVNQIGDFCFKGCSNTRVTLTDEAAEGLQMLGSYAFAGCTNLAMNLKYFTKLSTVGEGAFLECSSILSMEIPQKMQSIPDYCFTGCERIKTFVIASASELETIGKGAFSGCTSLPSIMNLEQATNLTEIGASAFSSCQIQGENYEACTALTSVEIPVSVETIGKAAFSGCVSLWEFDGTRATELKEMGESVLEGCTSLTDVSLSETKLTTLTKNMFYGCRVLECLTLPKTLESIEGGALSYCTSLSKMILRNPEKRVEIDAYAMWESWKNQVLKIYVPATEGHALLYQYWYSRNWNWVLSWKTQSVIQEMTLNDETFIENGGVYNPLEDGSYRLEQVLSTSKGTFVMKENTTEIAEDALKNCESMAILVIPNTLKSLPKGALSGCTGLEAMVLDVVEETSNLTIGDSLFGDSSPNENFVIWKSDQDTLLDTMDYPVKEYGTDCYVNEGVLYGTYMEKNVTRFCLQYIPRSYQGVLNIVYGTGKVADQAGKDCQGLTAVNSATTVETIGDYAFADCTSLEKVDLTSTSTSKLWKIGDYAFKGCTSLVGKNTSTTSSETQFLLPSGLLEYGKGMLQGCTSLQSVAMWGKISELPDDLCNGCVTLKTISMSSTLLKQVRRIGKRAFYNCEKITSISWSNMPNLQVVDESAYEGCRSLIQATFADQIQSFGNGCFKDTNLEMISFNGTVPPSLGKELMEEKIQEQVTVFVPAGSEGETYLEYYDSWKDTYPKLADSLVAQDGSGFRAISNVLYLINPDNTSQLTVMKVPTNLTSATIYNGTPYCVGLGAESFKNCTKITTLTIPNRVTSVGTKTFENCTSLKTVNIQGNVLKTLGSQAFLGCSSLKELILPVSVESIGDRMLENCSSFSSLYLNNYTPCKLGNKIFGDSVKENVRLIVPLASYDDYLRLWGKQLDEEYGKGTGVKVIEGLSGTEKIDQGICYEYSDGKWIEKTSEKTAVISEESEVTSEESTTQMLPSEQTTKSTMEQATERTTEQATERTTEQTTESTMEQTTESTMEQTTESTTEQAAESTSERTTESTNEQTTEATTEQTKESTMEQTTTTENSEESVLEQKKEG